jgi:1-acyl-sn-glycerol-3-phosphate acyltransferase
MRKCDVWPARWKLVSLWFSQIARVTADNALRFFVCLQYAKLGEDQKNSAWHLVTAVFMLPAIVLAPVNGALCNRVPKGRLLSGSALAALVVTALCVVVDGPWMVCWGLVAVTAAIYGPTRDALLPAAAADAKWPLTRSNAFIDMAAAGAFIAGTAMILCWPVVGKPPVDQFVQVAVICLLYAAAFSLALRMNFPSDVRREEQLPQAMRSFFKDGRTIWNLREARPCLVGMSGLRGVIIGMTGVLLPTMTDGGEVFTRIASIGCWIAAGVGIGSLLAGVQKHPRRMLGLVPWAGLGMTLSLLWAASAGMPSDWLCGVFGIMVGLINVPLASTYQLALPPEVRGNGMALRNMADGLVAAVTAGMLFALASYADFSVAVQLWLIAAIALVATLAAAWIFRREVVEQLVEFLFAIMYRFRAAGPGHDAFPPRGPVIVVANHSGYLDPMWLAKVLPRTVTPMMTAYFFDVPWMRWMMVYVFDAIRVEMPKFRRELPDMAAAIAALDANKCLVIFPEGRLRRTEERPLSMFGQGVWHILRERPDTPVVVCWIEGGWGSYVSYYQGLPMKNKPIDVRHPISIGVGAPIVVDADTLADHRKTRLYLMELCRAAREHLGLAPLAVQQMEAEDV